MKDFWLKRKANSFYNNREGGSGNSRFQDTSNLGFGSSGNGQNRQNSVFAFNSGTSQQKNQGKQANFSQIRKNYDKPREKVIQNVTPHSTSKVKYFLKHLKLGNIKIPKLPEAYKNGNASIFQLNPDKKLENLCFLTKYFGCLKCGRNHRNGNCKERNIPGYPCTKHHHNPSSGKFHNEAVHDDNYHQYVKQGLFKVIRNNAYCNTQSMESCHTHSVNDRPQFSEPVFIFNYQDEGQNFVDPITGDVCCSEDVKNLENEGHCYEEGEGSLDDYNTVYSRSEFLYGDSGLQTYCNIASTNWLEKEEKTSYNHSEGNFQGVHLPEDGNSENLCIFWYKIREALFQFQL